jgi:hypothetical protein
MTLRAPVKPSARTVVIGAALTLCLSVAGAAPAAADTPEPRRPSRTAVPAVAPVGVNNDDIYVDSAGRVIGTAEDLRALSDAQAMAVGCTPLSLPDNPHESGADVSGHGAWDKGTCKNNTADVIHCLYQYYPTVLGETRCALTL